MMVAPSLASRVRFSRCMTLSGDSLGMMTRGRRSLIVTSAARRTRLSDSPWDTAADRCHAAWGQRHASRRECAACDWRSDLGCRVIAEDARVRPTFQRLAERLLHLLFPHYPRRRGRASHHRDTAVQQCIYRVKGDQRATCARDSHHDGVVVYVGGVGHRYIARIVPISIVVET